MASPLDATFKKKYIEFIQELYETFPELKNDLHAAATIPPEEAMKLYAQKVVPNHTKLSDKLECPGIILPGVTISDSLWDTVGNTTKKAVYDYLSILDLASIYSSGMAGEGFSKEWAETIMKGWRDRMDKVDFESLSEKFQAMFGGGEGGLPKLPEKFLKGKLAQLAEDIVKEFKPEDFGLRPEDLAEVEKDPTRAFEILMKASSSNPHLLQTAMTRVGKKLQKKIQSGALRPQDLAAEAEELMQEFQSNPAFVQMMESFRSAFSFEDPAAARASGREDLSRLSAVKKRLREKLAAKQAAKK